jgi:hypothetical protein
MAAGLKLQLTWVEAQYLEPEAQEEKPEKYAESWKQVGAARLCSLHLQDLQGVRLSCLPWACRWFVALGEACRELEAGGWCAREQGQPTWWPKQIWL